MTNGFEQWADQELTPLCVCGHDKESHMIGVFLVTPSVRCHVVVQPEGPDFFCNCKGYTPRVNNV
jgi:hypothetical protein